MMTMSLSLKMALMATFLLATACDGLFDAPQCPAVINPAIVAEVRDSDTGAPIAHLATGEAVSGDHRKTMTPQAGDSLHLGVAGRGQQELLRVYSVTVEAAGYVPWSEHVPVLRGECGIKTTRITVRMEPAEG